MNRIICSIFKSPNKEEIYLYVPKRQGLRQVPRELLDLFGKPDHVIGLILTPMRKLARENIETVMAKIQEQGFYPQLPPPKKESIENTLAESMQKAEEAFTEAFGSDMDESKKSNAQQTLDTPFISDKK